MDNVFRRYWTPTEERKLFATVRSRSHVLARRDAAWLILLVKSGCRIGEFSKLSIRDAEFALETGWLFIPSELRKGAHRKPYTVLVKDGEGWKPKVVTPTPPPDHKVCVTKPIQEALEALLAIHRQMGGAGEQAAPLVLSRNGERMSIRGYQFKCAQWCFEAKVQGSPHFARHTRAMFIKRTSTSGDWRGVVMAGLGHASLESSCAYTRISKEDLQREMYRIDGAPRARKRDLRKRYEERRAS